MGVIISLIIIKSAFEILKDTINDLIGVRTDSELSSRIRKLINSYDDVKGVYDLTFHNYGPNKIIASAHIELDDSMKVADVHRLTRRIEMDIYQKYGIILTVGVYASNDTDKYKKIKSYIRKTLKNYSNIMEMHGFYVDEEYKIVSVDVIFNFEEENPEKSVEEIKNKLKEKYPNYDFSIILDTDFSD